MKIAVISHLKFPIAEPFAGGLEMLTHALATGLMKRGHEVDVFCHKDSCPTLNIIPIEVDRVKTSLTKNITPDHPDFDTKFIQSHHTYMDIMLHLQDADYDVIHNNSLHYLPLTMARTLKTPMVTTLHVPPFPFMQSSIIAAQKYPANHHYVSISKHTHRDWLPFTKGSHTIYNGVDVDFWPYRPSVTADSAVWFGRICPEKGTHFAIEAAKRSGTFLYIGGKIANQEYYDEKVKPLLDSQHNIYIGHITQKEMAQYIKRTKVSLFTSMWEEPYGLVIAEALACGTPVAAFRSGASPEIITKKTGRIVEKGDINALAQAINECKNLNRADCRKRAEKFCSIEAMVMNYENFFRKIAVTKKQLIPALLSNKKSLVA